MAFYLYLMFEQSLINESMDMSILITHFPFPLNEVLVLLSSTFISLVL